MDAEKKSYNKKSFQMNIKLMLFIIILIAVTKICLGNIITPDSCGVIDKIFYSGVLVICALLAVSMLAVINLVCAAIAFIFPPHIGPVIEFKKKYIKVSFNVLVKAMYYFIMVSPVMLLFGILWAPGKLIGLFG